MEKECPGCESHNLTMLPARRWLCQSCNLEMTGKQAESRDRYYLISSPIDARPDRVELGTDLNVAVLHVKAERMNGNRRANARRGRVIERGQLAQDRLSRLGVAR